MKPDSPYHVPRTHSIDDDVTIEAARDLYGYEGRREDVVDSDGDGIDDATGEPVAFLTRTVTYYEASRAPTRRAGDRWFECPVTGEWLPWSSGVTIEGTRYSREAAADIIEERRRRRL